MSIHPLAGKPAPDAILENIPRLISHYYVYHPNPSEQMQRILFGTSGHRGTANEVSFNEDHVLTISQAICDYRKEHKIDGPLFLGMDTHALSEAAFITAVEVFAANEVDLMIQQGRGYTPTPVISHAILTFNRSRREHLADGVVITPSHNPPDNGGIKYNPPSGGPADTTITRWIEDRANELLAQNLKSIKRLYFAKALQRPSTHFYDYISPYVSDLENVIDFDIIRAAGLKIGVDPLGGSGLAYWQPISEKYHLQIEVINKSIDPTFRFMTVDKDGKIRMDCSSPYAMAGLVALKDKYDISFGNDPDFDRHGIVTRSVGLMNPNHYLAVAIWYLFQYRPKWQKNIAIGKTLVSSSMIDRVAISLGRSVYETPVGFKWFVDGLLNGTLGFGGEESAGASFLRKDGSVWTTDKDGFIMDLLAAEIYARIGKDPGEIYRELETKFGPSFYQRIDAAADAAQRKALQNISRDAVCADTLAGEKILQVLTHAPGNGVAIGGLKVITKNGWFAARPSGTENVYKIYAESFISEEHLRTIQQEAQQLINSTVAT